MDEKDKEIQIVPVPTTEIAMVGQQMIPLLAGERGGMTSGVRPVPVEEAAEKIAAIKNAAPDQEILKEIPAHKFNALIPQVHFAKFPRGWNLPPLKNEGVVVALRPEDECQFIPPRPYGIGTLIKMRHLNAKPNKRVRRIICASCGHSGGTMEKLGDFYFHDKCPHVVNQKLVRHVAELNAIERAKAQ